MAFVRKNKKDGNVSAPVAPSASADAGRGAAGASTTANGAPAGGHDAGSTPVVPKSINTGQATTRLGEQLIGSRLITQEQLDAALADQVGRGRTFGRSPRSVWVY